VNDGRCDVTWAGTTESHYNRLCDCDACPPVASSAVTQLSRASQIDTTSSYLKPAPTSSSSLSLSRAWTTATAADLTDTASLPPSPPALELQSSTSPKVIDHF
jgi:hypothetical protein